MRTSRQRQIRRRIRKVLDRHAMKLGGLTIAGFTRHWMGTLDYQGIYHDLTVDPARPGFQGPAVFLFWHEYILFPFYLRGHCRISMLLSRHQDAEWLSEAARHMGFGTIRGSTNRGGVAALRELLRAGRSMNLTLTPDGPRGPRRQLAAGCIYVASRLGIPLVPIGFGYDRPWRYRRAWDQFALPRPYSRARHITGPRIFIPERLDRAGVEWHRQLVEDTLNRLTVAAEQWAESGRHYRNQCPTHRGPLAGGRAQFANGAPVPHPQLLRVWPAPDALEGNGTGGQARSGTG